MRSGHDSVPVWNPRREVERFKDERLNEGRGWGDCY